jgi:hypothetical protein
MSAYLQTVELLSTTNMHMGVQQTAKDAEIVKRAIRDAKQLCPSHDAVPYLEADVMARENKIEEAMQLCDQGIKNADKGDGFPYIMKANVSSALLAQTIERLHQGDQASLPTFQLLHRQIHDLYTRALEEEPESVDAMLQIANLQLQLAHIQGMQNSTAPMKEALSYLEKASKLGRNMDELVTIVTERNHLRVTMRALEEYKTLF